MDTELDEAVMSELQPPCDLVEQDGVNIGALRFVIKVRRCDDPAAWILLYLCPHCDKPHRRLMCERHHDIYVADPSRVMGQGYETLTFISCERL